MAATATFHFVCDACGKRAEMEQNHPNQNIKPDGWVTFWYGSVTGDYCSEPCLRQVLVTDAIDRSIRAFNPVEAEVPA